MSRVVDERVVSMQFDNKQFEKNAATSIGTLEKLKRSLNLSGASKGLENVNAAAKKCNLSPISNAAETVGLKFNAMYTIADQSLRNIVNSAMAAGKRITSALTIDPIKTGFQEYETQINAVQTILANTQSKGTTLDDVNAALDTLNTYADKTIYNFTEMTRNIGTFTAAGVDLDTAVNSIQGIANLAAVSGSTSQQASTAMYQLSQALAAGTVKLMDWNSVVNAGMGGQVFQDALKETARAHGIAIDQMIEDQGSFRETLKDGWLSSEILTDTLQKFTLTTEGLSDAQIEANRQMLASKGYTEAQIEEIFKLGETATNAATKVKTFTQLWDTLKEAAQSGWTQTWELIVGDFEEAKELWTGVSDTIGGFINRMSESRNSVLGGAMVSKWDKFTEKMKEVGVSTTEFEEKLRDVLDDHGYDVDKMIEKYGSFEKALKAGAYPVANLKEAIERLSTSMVDLSGIDGLLKKGISGDDVKKVQEALMGMGFDMDKYGADGIFGKVTEEAVRAFQELEGLKVDGIIGPETLAALEKATESSGDLRTELMGLIDGVDELGGRERLLNAFKNLWQALSRPIKAVGEAWNNVFGTSTESKSAKLFGLIKGFESFTEKLIISSDSADKISRIFSGLFSILKTGGAFVGGGFRAAFKLLSAVLENFDLNILDVAASIGDALTAVHDWIRENNYLADAISFIAGMFMLGAAKIGEWVNAFINLPQVQTIITNIGKAFRDFGDYIGGGIDRVHEFLSAVKKFDLKQIFSDDSFGKSLRKTLTDNFKTNVLGYFSGIGEKLSGFVSKIVGSLLLLKDSAGKYLSTTGDKFEAFKEKISGFFSSIKQWIGDNKGAIVAFGSLLSLILILSKIKKAVTAIAKPFDAFGDIAESFQTFIDSFTAINRAKALKIRTEAVKNIATAVTLLAGALWVISKIPKDDIWRAVGVMGILAGGVLIMVALVKVIDMIPSKSETNISKFGSMMASLGISLLLMTASVKILGDMNPDQLKQGMKAVGLFLGAMALFMLLSKPISKDAASFGKMIRKLSTSLLLLSGVIFILGKMDPGTLGQGMSAVAIFLIGMAAMMRMTKEINKDSAAFGKMIRSLSISLLILSGVVYILGNMKTETLIKGGVAVAAFLGIMLGAMRLVKPMSADVTSFGKMMFGLSAGLLLMALSIKILGGMDAKTLVKGGLVAIGFVGIVATLMSATKLMGKYSFNAGKMGLLLLSFAASALLISGAIAALSMIEGPKLAKALAAVAGIGIIMAGLLAVTRFAKNIKTGSIIGLSIAIAVMATSIAALSFIDPAKLKSATIALGSIMGMFSLMAYASKSITGKGFVGMAGMILIVGGIGILITSLTKHVKNADSAIKVATAVSELILALSVSVLLLSKIGGTGTKAYAGVGVMAAIMGVVGIFAGIAIWQLPNIAKQLSKFMKNLMPFIRGMEHVDSSMVKNIKTLGEAMAAFVGAGGDFAFANAFSFGGVSRAFTKFGEFLKEIVPIVKDIAVDVSGENLNINHDNLNSIVNAVKGLSEAASNAPSASAAAAITKFGGAGYIDIPLLSTFVTFIKEAVPLIKDMALELSGSNVDINTKNLDAVVGAVGSLADAADKAPSVDIAGAFTKFTGGWGAGGVISIPGLAEFISFIRELTPIMSGFALDVSNADISESDTIALKSICEAVGVLGEAAGAAPSTEIIGGFSKFAGGWGVAGGISIPGFVEFISFVKEVVPVMSGFALDISETSIDSKDTAALVSICEAVGVLGEAAGKAPTTDVAAGFAKFAGGVGAGAYVSIPGLENFVTFVSEVVPIMSGFALDVSATTLTSDDTAALVSICEAVGVLAEAAKAAPGTELAGGLAAVGPAIAGGVYVKNTDLQAFTDWITSVATVMSGFAIDVKEANISEEDGAKLQSICKAVEILAQAAKYAPKEEVCASWFGVYVSTTDLDDFTAWIVDVIPTVADIASDISTASAESGGKLITAEGLSTIKSICNSVKTLAEAAKLAPKKEAYSNIFGTWVEVEDIEGFTDWIKQVMAALKELGEELSGDDVIVDTEKLKAMAKAAASLGEAFYYFSTGSTLSTSFITLFPEYITAISDTLKDFSKAMKEVDTDAVSKASTAAFDLANTITILTNFDPESVNLEDFRTTATGIAEAVDQFAIDIAEVDVSTAATKAKDIKAVVDTFGEVDTSGIDSFCQSIRKIADSDFTGLGDIGDSLKTIGKDAVDKFIGAFKDAAPKALAAATMMVTQLRNGFRTGATTIPSAVKTIINSASSAANGGYTGFFNAGKSCAEGFAKGITMNTFLATAKAKAMAVKAYEAAKKALDVNSPSKIFRSLGYSVPEGFAMGIDRLGGMVKKSTVGMADTALSSTKKAIAHVAELIDSDIDVQPTIRPVVDLSNVSAGANAISGMFDVRPSVGVMSNINAISSMMGAGQNGSNSDVVSAIEDLGRKLGKVTGNTYNTFEGITYDDESSISGAVKVLVDAARVGRRR